MYDGTHDVGDNDMKDEDLYYGPEYDPEPQYPEMAASFFDHKDEDFEE